MEAAIRKNEETEAVAPNAPTELGYNLILPKKRKKEKKEKKRKKKIKKRTFKSFLVWSLPSRHAHPKARMSCLPPAYTDSATRDSSK